MIVLLIKRLSGEIDASENQQLDAWLQQSPAHAELARQYQSVWEKVGTTPKAFDQLDMDAEFRQLQRRLQAAPAPRVKVIPLGARLLRIAAVFTLLLAAVWAYREYTAAPTTLLRAVAANTEKRLLELPDGSRIWLRNNSTLEYPETFAGQERRVKLRGEAYFEISHRPEQPFRIELFPSGMVEVLGTRFNVRAAQNEDQSVVLVRDGRVRFYPETNSGGHVLGAGDRATYSHSEAQLRLSKVTSFNDLAWQTGGLEFVRTPLKDVLSDLEKFYHVKIELRNPALAKCPYTAPLTSQPIGQVLEILSLAYQLQVTSPAPGQFILSGGRCN